MKALVTGGNGPVGSHIVDLLISKGYEVRILGTLANEAQFLGKSWINTKAELFKGNLVNLSDLEKAIEGVDLIFHQAALTRFASETAKYYEVNAVGTANIFDAIKRKSAKIKKVIFASTTSAYGEGKYLCEEHGFQYPDPRPISQLEKKDWELKCEKCNKNMKPVPTDESSLLKPTTPYAQTKIAGEWITLNSGAALKIPVVVLRTPLIYGEREYKRVFQMFANSLHHGKDITLNEDGNQLRDCIHMADVARANLFAAENNIEGIYNLSSGFAVSLKDIVKELAVIFGKEPKLNITNNYRFGDSRHNVSDASKIANAGFKPMISLKEGLNKYKAWIESEHGLNGYFKKVDAALSAK